jgi:hypothetical protein
MPIVETDGASYRKMALFSWLPVILGALMVRADSSGVAYFGSAIWAIGFVMQVIVSIGYLHARATNRAEATKKMEERDRDLE